MNKFYSFKPGCALTERRAHHQTCTRNDTDTTASGLREEAYAIWRLCHMSNVKKHSSKLQLESEEAYDISSITTSSRTLGKPHNSYSMAINHK